MKKNIKHASYHHGDLASTLLKVSEKLIARKGVAAFSLREAARIAGVDPSACYRHYKNKNAILTAIAQRGFTDLSQMMRKNLTEDSNELTENKIFTLAKSYLEFAEKKTFYFRVMFGPLDVDSRDPSLSGQYLKGEGPYDLLLDTIQKWLSERKIKKDANQLSLELWSAIHGFANLSIDGAIRNEFEGKGAEAFIQQFVSTILRGYEIINRH